MHAPVATIDADMPIVEVAQLFAEREYRRYPVTEDARLVGQISRSDVLRALQEIAGQSADLRTSIPPRT
jgi:CBS domain-containing protein